MRFPNFTIVSLAAVLGVAAMTADAVTLRWAGRGDMQTTDPHSQNEGLTNNINALVYEFLVTRDKKLGLVPGLAESWTQVNPTTWRFKLRPGVKFHDGTPFTADDVVFSYQRAAADTSQLRAYSNAAGVPKKIDDLTVEFTTNGPNPIELEHTATINIMSKAWCEKNKCQKPQNFAAKEDMITAREANGTGPYSLVSRQPDVKTVLKKNPNWWGIKAGQFDGNVDDVIYTPIVSDATRVAALISGEVDLVNDPPPQDVPQAFADAEHQGDRRHREPHHLHRHGPGARRASLLQRQGQEPVQGRARAPGAIPGRRHRRDQQEHDARPVETDRRHPSLARDVDARDREAASLRQGQGQEAARGRRLSERLRGDARLPEQPLRQRRADLPGARGDVVADRRHVKVNTMPRAVYFPKLEKTDTSLFMLGWGGASTDAIFTLQPVLSTYNGKGDGDFNYGRYTNQKVNDLTAKVKVEMTRRSGSAISTMRCSRRTRMST